VTELYERDRKGEEVKKKEEKKDSGHLSSSHPFTSREETLPR